MLESSSLAWSCNSFKIIIASKNHGDECVTYHRAQHASLGNCHEHFVREQRLCEGRRDVAHHLCPNRWMNMQLQTITKPAHAPQNGLKTEAGALSTKEPKVMRLLAILFIAAVAVVAVAEKDPKACEGETILNCLLFIGSNCAGTLSFPAICPHPSRWLRCQCASR